jgi:hypothetical protein
MRRYICAVVVIGALVLVACGGSKGATRSRSSDSDSSSSSSKPESSSSEGWRIGDCANVGGIAANKVSCDSPLTTHHVVGLEGTQYSCPESTTKVLETTGRLSVVCFAPGSKDLEPGEGPLGVGSCIAIIGGSDTQAGGNIGGTPTQTACTDPAAVYIVTEVDVVGATCPDGTSESFTRGVNLYCLATR